MAGMKIGSDCDRCANTGVAGVIGDFEILVGEIVQILYSFVQPHVWQGERLPGQLQICLFKVIAVQVSIAQRMNEVTGLQAADLGHHQGEQRITGDVERHAEKNIRAALVELAGKPAVTYIELEEGMAGRQGHPALSDIVLG